MKQTVEHRRPSVTRTTAWTRAPFRVSIWIRVHCIAFVLVVVCSCISQTSGGSDAQQLDSDGPLEGSLALATSGTNASVVLDFTGVEGRGAIEVNLHGRKFWVTDGPYDQELEFLTISLHDDTDSSDYKVLVTLVNLNCNSNGNGSAYLWIEDESGQREEYCHNFQTDIIISEGQREVTIGISSDWSSYHYAAMDVAVYYDPTGGYCVCDSSWHFCCEPCPPANMTHPTQLASDLIQPSDADTGYCMNKLTTQLDRCDYWTYCPCLPFEEPDWSLCDSPGEGFPMVGVYIAIGLIAGGIVVVVAIIFCLIVCCFRRGMCTVCTQSPDASSPTITPTPTSAVSHQNWNIPPPPYEATPESEVFTTKPMNVLEFVGEREPSPPPYERVVKA